MKIKTPQEILATTPEESVREAFVSILGIDLGLEAYADFSTNPEYREKFEKMILKYLEHQRETDKLLQHHIARMGKIAEKETRVATVLKYVLIAMIIAWIVFIIFHFGNLALQ